MLLPAACTDMQACLFMLMPAAFTDMRRWAVSLEAVNKPALHTAYASQTWMGLVLQPELPAYTFFVLTG